MNTIKAIITDFDGTLFDTFDAHADAYKLAFDMYDLKFDRDTYRRLFGMSWKDIAPQLGVPVGRVGDISAIKSVYYRERFDIIKPNTDLIHKIETFDGSVAIATAGNPQMIKHLIENKLGPDHLLNNCIYSCDNIRPNRRRIYI